MSYISSLNILSDDPSIPVSEEDVTDELALWANAQFKFDSTPGSALLDDPLKSSTHTDSVYGVLNDFNNFDHQHSLVTDMVTPSANNPIKQHHPSLIPMMSPDLYASPTSACSTMTAPTFDVHSTTDSLFTNESTLLNDTTKQLSQHQEDIGNAPKTKVGMDEDKRRRNTAASARFRQKKKLREQALQQTVKEMTSKTEALEKRCQELELEAKWLRALLVEKNPALVTPLSTASASLKS
ncbi:hypothetical protein BCR42DRAFT_365396, partial [Absidia repens]